MGLRQQEEQQLELAMAASLEHVQDPDRTVDIEITEEEVGTAWDDDAAEELLNLPPPPYTPAGGNQPIVVEQDSVALDIGQMNEEEMLAAAIKQSMEDQR